MFEPTTFGALVSAGHLELGDGYRTKRSEHGKPGLPILRVAEVLDGRISPAFEDYVSSAYRKAMRSKVSQPGDVVLTTKGTVGRVAIVPDDSPEFVYSPQLCYFRVRTGSPLLARYLYYWFGSDYFWSQARSLKSQTDMADYINLADIRSLQISVPPLSIQQSIAEVLGALDDKIAVNERVARISTQLALAYGQQLLLDADGEQVALADHAEIVKGVSYRSADLASGTNGLVTLKCVGRDGTFQSNGLKPFSGPYKEKQIVEHGDIVVAQTDLTQRAEVIGRPVRVSAPKQAGRLVASLDLVAVKPGPSLTREILFALLSTQDFRGHALGYCNGTTVLHMGVRALAEYRFRLPDKQVVESATDVMAPLFERSDSAKQEVQALARLRDTLLPGLMSGAIRVRDAEKAVEEAT